MIMGMFSKASVPVAELPKQTRNLRSYTAFTNNFFNLTPVFRRKLYVGDSVKLTGGRFSRTLPLPLPAFATVDDVFRAFYVPYKSVYPAIDDVLQNTLHVDANGTSGVINKVPHCLADDLSKAFFISGVGVFCNATALTPDITFKSSGADSPMLLTYRGAQVYKVLKGLGYEFKTNLDYEQGKQFNLLPLLCYCRVVLDFYWPKNYTTSSLAATILGYCKRDNGNPQFSQAEVFNMLQFIGWSFYEDKNYVDAWDNPNAPNELVYQSSVHTIGDIDTDSGLGISNYVRNSPTTYNGQAVYQRGTGSPVAPVGVTKFGLNLLNSLSDWLKRHQLAGASAVDRFLAQHGKKLEYTGERSYFCGEVRCPVKISDVPATTESTNQNLGVVNFS